MDCPLYASSLLHLPECLLPVAHPLILPVYVDPVLWIKAGEKDEEASSPYASGGLTVGIKGDGVKNMYRYD